MMAKPVNEVIGQILNCAPRNAWERQRQAFIRDLTTYLYRDPRSIDAFCRLVATYEEEILRLALLLREFGGVEEMT